MRTNSYLTTAALAAALLCSTQLTYAQGLSIDLGGAGVDVEVGGDNLVDVDADLDDNDNDDRGVSVDLDTDRDSDEGLDVDLDVGGSDDDDRNVVDLDINSDDEDRDEGRLVDVDLGGSGDRDRDDDVIGVDLGSDRVVDVDLDRGGATGPNGGTLIDLGAPTRSDPAAIEANVDLTSPATNSASGTNLITGDVRISALGSEADRAETLIELIADPNLADIDLDAAIDDRRVSITALADLLGTGGLADIQAAVDAGGAGRNDLLSALSDSSELSAILASQGIDLDDVLAVQVAENGATEVFVLDDTARVALLGDNGNLADLAAGDLTAADLDLLSEDELAELDLDLLPGNLRTLAQLRLLATGGDLADAGVADLAAIDLDLLSRDELAEIDLDLLPEQLQSAITVRLLGTDGDLADVSVDELLDIGLTDADDGTDTDGDTGTVGSLDPDNGGTDSDTGGNGDNTSGRNQNGTNTGALPSVLSSGGSDTGTTASGTLVASATGGASGIAALSCDIGVLALARGAVVTPQAVVAASSLELVSITGCERMLVDPDMDAIQAALAANPAVSDVLDGASIPLEEVIGATMQGGTLTLFINSDSAIG